MRAQRSYDFLSRYEAILAKNHDWSPIDFSSKRVLELGSGPVLGWGPYAIFRGAQSYVGCDPSSNQDILKESRFVKRYCLPLYRDLSALFGTSLSFADFLEAMETNMQFESRKTLEADLEGPFDIVLSNSCLEHITPLQKTIDHIASLTAPGGRMLHLVDFGNHKATENPFEGLYNQPRQQYLETHGEHINLHRAPDVKSFLEQAGLQVLQSEYYSAPEFFSDEIHDYWKDRYSESVLFQRVMIFGCQKSPLAQ